MKTEVKNLSRGQVELTIELSAEEYQPFLQIAAVKISEQVKIPGFRPGKADLATVSKQVGENEVWQEAFEPAVKKTLFAAIDENKLQTVGQPQVDVIKLAPGNEVVYKAVLSLLPEVTLGDLSKISIAKVEIKISEAEVEKVLVDLQKSRAKEALVDRPSQKGDKLEIDFDTLVDGVPIENGQSQKYPIVIGESTFIPGFEDQLIGLKASDNKEFILSFPENYHQKNLAGKPATFKVKVNSVYQMDLPAIDDTLAKSLGQFADLAALKKEIEHNLHHEKEHQAEAKIEEQIFDQLIEVSKFSDIPDVLVDSETKKMLEELEHNISHYGIKFADYLIHLKKTEDDLLLEFAPQALKRVKSALLVRQVALDNKLAATEEEITAELARMSEAYGDNADAKKTLNNPAYRDYLKNILSSQKVVAYLKSQLVK